MALANRTWQQIRTSVGYNLRAYRSIEADGPGTPTTFLTDELSLGGSEEHRGGWIVFTSGTNDGSLRRIVTSARNTNTNLQTLTYHPATAAATANGDTAEIWGNEGVDNYNPEALLDFANQAIMDAYSAVYDPVEDISLHGARDVVRFDIPSGFSMLKRVEYRYGVTETLVHDTQSLFDETTDAEWTQSLDAEDWRRNGQSLKIVLGASAEAGDVVTDSISSIDISKYTHLEGWIKSTTALDANDYVVHLDSGVVQADGTDLESLNIPAVAADTWTYFRVALAQSEADTAIVSVGIEMNVDKGAHTVWFNDLQVTVNDSALWRRLPKRSWSIDKEARDLLLTRDGRTSVGYSLIKLVGGDEPALLTGDSSVNEIDDQYVVAQTTALALDSESRPRQDGELVSSRRAQLWYARAERRRAAFPFLTSVRRIE